MIYSKWHHPEKYLPKFGYILDMEVDKKRKRLLLCSGLPRLEFIIKIWLLGFDFLFEFWRIWVVFFP